jgi:hypothetical protein
MSMGDYLLLFLVATLRKSVWSNKAPNELETYLLFKHCYAKGIEVEEEKKSKHT